MMRKEQDWDNEDQNEKGRYVEDWLSSKSDIEKNVGKKKKDSFTRDKVADMFIVKNEYERNRKCM
ncbi:MAG: hypothetical protein GY721_02480 [Deltaproteobacteria bacterium]|nr:hypothetical protein [Deltaproteobacteria bacterium]